MMSCIMMAEMSPIYYEGFSRCYDDEGEHYGYTGGNDNQWGGEGIATAMTIYQDAPEWTFTNCNAGDRCLKVGTSKQQGSASTPSIACEGDVVLTFRVAPWEGDSLFYVSIQGGTTTDPKAFELKKHQWTNVTIRITDIQSSIRLTFTSYYKHRFFLDDVCVRPVDPTAGAIRTQEGSLLDWGLLGRYYTRSSRTLHVEGANLRSEGITATLAQGETNYFALSSTTLPAAGGELTVTCQTGAPEGMHGCYLYLRGKDVQTGETVEKKVTLKFEVSWLDLEGSGTKPDPYTCGDVLLLAVNEGTVWTDEYYWVTGYVLGGVKRYNNQYDGISMTDNQSLVIAANPTETNENKYVTVQISGNARAALNVVDNPELIGKQIKVQGFLLNENANPLYLGKPGVLNVRTDAQYVRPAKEGEGLERLQAETAGKKRIENGRLVIVMPDGTRYDATGIKCK